MNSFAATLDAVLKHSEHNLDSNELSNAPFIRITIHHPSVEMTLVSRF